jgi:hypothetical protein
MGADYAAWIYVMKCDDHPELVKVGLSSDPVRRAFDVRKKGALLPIVEYAKQVSNAIDVERKAHQSLQYCRARGEWFKCSVRPNRESVERLRNLAARFDQLQNGQLRHEELLRAELAQSRQEAGTHARDSRTEILEMLQRLSDSILGHLAESQKSQSERLQSMTKFLSDANTQFRDVLERSVKAFQTELKSESISERADILSIAFG